MAPCSMAQNNSQINNSMIMKRLFCIIAAAILAIPQLAGKEEPIIVNEESKTYKVESFDAINVSWIYKVRLTQSRNPGVTIEAPDFIMPYLVVKVRNSCLILSLDNVPRNLKRRLENGKYEVRAYVSMKRLSKLEMSGASKLEANGESFLSDDDCFKLYLSGASKMDNLNITAKRTDIECSGASKFQLEGNFKEVEMDLSGASKGSLKTDSKKLDIELSGASNLKVYGNQEKVRIQASGASDLEMDGTMEQVTLTGSGACKAHLLDCPVLWAKINLSGACTAKIDVKESLGVYLSGASNCLYRAGEKMTITETNVARGSTLRKL